MTEVDKRVLASLPRGEWFDWVELDPRFKNREYRLRRLEEAGVLESEMQTNQGMGGPSRRWRVKEGF